MDETMLRKAHCLLHPARYRLVELIREKPRYINELTKLVKDERRLVTYHLQALEDAGLVTSHYEISEAPKSRGKATRIYEATDNVDAVIQQLNALT